MKKAPFFLLVLSISATVLFSSFVTIDNPNSETNTNPSDEFEILLNYLETTNALINGESLPIIMADDVRKNIKNEKFHIIDIRTDAWFEYGHIKNATNVKAKNLLTYFNSTITPSDFEKIVLVCYSGQSAAYYSGLLRLAGYDNVYSMKWGMSSWREDFADNAWTKNTKTSLVDKLETNVNAKPEKGEHPVLGTGKTEAKEILKARLETLFAIPYKEFILKPAEVFETPNNYFIINYGANDSYVSGHIPGAIQYKPNTSLLAKSDLLTLPLDKKIAIYTSTGQEAAYVVAYLNVLGYNIANIAYGENGFMKSILKDNGWDAFTNKEINMYPVIE